MTHSTHLAYLLPVLFAIGCSAGYKAGTTPAAQSAADAEPKELDRSVFARDPAGQLTESSLQEILDSPLTLELPARVGILPIIEAADWRGPGPDHAIAPDAVSHLARSLKSENFTLVTEMMPIPSGALGMEALREMAARYKLRYLVLYRENIRRDKKVNAWAVGYITLIGAAFLPGSTLEIDGYVEASLFDVKTGLLMFTVRERVAGKEKSNVWHREAKLARMQEKAALKVANELAVAVRKSVFQYAAATEVENERIAERAVERSKGRASAALPTAANDNVSPESEPDPPAEESQQLR